MNVRKDMAHVGQMNQLTIVCKKQMHHMPAYQRMGITRTNVNNTLRLIANVSEN